MHTMPVAHPTCWKALEGSCLTHRSLSLAYRPVATVCRPLFAVADNYSIDRDSPDHPGSFVAISSATHPCYDPKKVREIVQSKVDTR